MVFSSTVFLFLFLPGLLIMYYALKSRVWKNFILLLSSILFYAWGEPIFVFIMLFSVFVNWFLVLKMESGNRKLFMLLAIIFDVSLLGIFKYASFISRNIALLGFENVRVNIALPIGISFFTFQMMSYVFDVYYGKSKIQKNFFNVALYITLFPQLIAGPIVRYSQVEDEILNRNENFETFSDGVQRFIYGLGKKVLLANFMAQIADNVFDYIPNPSVLMSWLGALAYTFQIYFDFSGYSDMAIGLGLMFGFHFSENFNYPYLAGSIREFWRRWHDYVYIPMGGSRVKKSRYVLNIFTVWLLTGIWHGANWTFMLWGMIYFVFIMLEHKFDVHKRLGILSHLYTLLIVIFAWVIFRAVNVTSGMNYICSMLGLNSNLFCDSGFIEYLRSSWVVLIFALIGIFPIIPKIRSSKIYREWIEQLFVILIFILSLLEVISSTYNPFIYFNF